jgi:hypothetical protein
VEACSNKVLLPAPGSPPISTTEPGTKPPPKHAVKLGKARANTLGFHRFDVAEFFYFSSYAGVTNGG